MTDTDIVRIRPIKASDKKLALFMVGKANMESLGLANHQTYRHPLTLILWLLLSLTFVHLVNWWPSTHKGLIGMLGFIKPLPAFASVAVPIMFLIDWKNRPHFEDRTQAMIREKDMRDPVEFYSHSPGSGFWILEFGETFIGLIALDANDARKTKRGRIRHFFVEEQYRKTGIQNDLLNHAVSRAFENKAVERIEGLDAPQLAAYIHNSYQGAGFVPSPEFQVVGEFGGWKYYTTTLERKDWKKAN